MSTKVIINLPVTKVNQLPPMDEVNSAGLPTGSIAITGSVGVAPAAKPIVASYNNQIMLGKRMIYGATVGTISPNNAPYANCRINEIALGYEVKKLRKALNLTQAELAKKAQLGRSTICHAENGYAGFSTIMRIAHCLGKTMQIV